MASTPQAPFLPNGMPQGTSQTPQNESTQSQPPPPPPPLGPLSIQTYGMVPPSPSIQSPYPPFPVPSSPFGQTSFPPFPRPRAHTGGSDNAPGALSLNPAQNSYRPGTRAGPPPPPPPPPFPQAQRIGPPGYLPPPPPTGTPPHMVAVPPPPPPRNLSNFGPPGSQQNPSGLPPHWSGPWGRSAGYHAPPPPPPPPTGQSAAVPYNPSAYAQQETQSLVSATYIPGLDSFGPSPGYYPGSDSDSAAQSPIVGRNQVFNFPPRPADHLPTVPVPQNVPIPIPAPQPPPQTQKKGHSKSPSASALQSPPSDDSGVGKEWPLEKVLNWLSTNGFSRDWQHTFQALNIHGNKFLDIGIGLGGKGNIGMMHQQIFPQLAKECKLSGTGWDQARERPEAKRLRTCIRGIFETEESPQTQDTSQSEISSSTGPPLSEAGFHAEHRSKTPSTAGTGNESPSEQQIAYMGSSELTGNHRAGMFLQPGANGSDTSLGQRSGFIKAALGAVEGQIKRHSPSQSNDMGVNSFRPESPHMPAADSPKSGSPGPNSFRDVPPSPFSRVAHHKSNSTDSVASSLPRPVAPESRKHSIQTNIAETAKESRWLQKFRRKKKDDGSHPSPEEQHLESPTSPQDSRKFVSSTSPYASGRRDVSLERASPRMASSGQDAHHYAMARSRSSQARRYALVTLNGLQFSLVDITDSDTPDALRAAICNSVGIVDGEYINIHATDLGQTELEEPLSEISLLNLRRTRGDENGSLKFYVKSAHLSATSASPAISGLGIGRKAVPSPSAAQLVFPHRIRGESSPSRFAADDQTKERGPNSTPSTNELNEQPSAELAALVEEHRKDVLKKQEAYLKKQQLRIRRDSEIDPSTPGIKREGVVDFDHPRVSPYEDKRMEPAAPRTDILIPQRKPPPPPAESATLTKANSLRRKNTNTTPRHSVTLQTVDDETPIPPKRTSTRNDAPVEFAQPSWRSGAITASPPLSPSTEKKDAFDSDSDSDDGLFAVPLAGRVEKKSTVPPVPPAYDGNISDGKSRPSLTVNTKPEKKTVVIKTPIPPSSGSSVSPPVQREQSKPSWIPDPVARTANTDREVRRDSFARDGVWAPRPPAEAIMDNLDHFFPNVDLDQPLIEGESTPISATPYSDPSQAGNSDVIPLGQTFAQRKMARSGGLGRTKSIREVVRNANVNPVKPTVMPQMHTSALNKPSPLSNNNIVRRKSTKMFGAKIVQVKPTRGALEPIPQATVMQDNVTGPVKTFRWVKGELIGTGSFGKVFVGLNSDTGDFLAVKQVELNGSRSETQRQKELIASLELEVDTMKDLDHPNIVQWLGFERNDLAVSIFLEYISGGSIGSCLRQHGRFDERTVRSFTRQSLEGLSYLHDQGILHRDLKGDNILLVTDGTCKITDFGISKKTDNIYGNDASSTMQGSVFWMAPEVIKSQEGYSAKIDIWSMGCVVLEMFSGHRPWAKEETIGVIYKLGELGELPPIPEEVRTTISPEALGFMYDCFTLNPQFRPRTDQLLKESTFCAYDPTYNFKDTDIYKKMDLVPVPMPQARPSEKNNMF